MSGKGEIRTHRDVTMRKRKRHNSDKDVGSISRHYGYEGDSSGSDSDSSDGPGGRSKGKGNQGKQRGSFESFFHALNKYPHTPDHMQRWMQLGANVFLISVLTYVCWSVVSTVRADISTANSYEYQKLLKLTRDCRQNYEENDCFNNKLPGLKLQCADWYECMIKDPGDIMRVKVTAKQVAEIINEFTETMHLKAWVCGLR